MAVLAGRFISFLMNLCKEPALVPLIFSVVFVFYFVAFVHVIISFLLLVSHVICSFQFPKEETGVLD